MRKTNVKVLLSGGSFSGNKGAEAMYDFVIDELNEYYEKIDVTILSKYPGDDKGGARKEDINWYVIRRWSRFYMAEHFISWGVC